jgi:hypothetical protein
MHRREARTGAPLPRLFHSIARLVSHSRPQNYGPSVAGRRSGRGGEVRTTGWVVADARAQLSARADLSEVPFWEQWWSRRDVRNSLGWVLAVAAAIQFGSYGLVRFPWDFWPSLQGGDPGGLQQVLWQVDAGLVAIALPVLFLISQHAASLHDDMLGLPVAEVLRSETGMVPILVFAAFGLARVGADAVWFQAQAVLTFDFFAVFLVTLALLGFASLRLFQLATSPLVLKSHAEAHLQARLADAIDDSWAVTRGNDAFVQAIEAAEGLTIRYNPFAAAAVDDGEWIKVAPSAASEIADLHPTRLTRLLATLVSPSAPVAAATAEPTVQAGTPERPQVAIVRLAGESVRALSPVLVLRRDAFADTDSDAAWETIKSAYQMSADD